MPTPVNDNIDGPYLSCKALCVDCKHEWVGVAPVGVVALECPRCHTLRGVWYGVCMPTIGLPWICACDNDTFLLSSVGAPTCTRCGLRATGWVEAEDHAG